MSKLENFNPNAKNPPTIEWATYCPERRTAPIFKVHKRKSDAMNAVTDPSILYHFVNGEWEEVFRIENYQAPDYCENCNKLVRVDSEMNSWVTDETGKRELKRVPYIYHKGHRKWKNTTPGKMDVIFLCYECSRYWKIQK